MLSNLQAQKGEDGVVDHGVVEVAGGEGGVEGVVEEEEEKVRG